MWRGCANPAATAVKERRQMPERIAATLEKGVPEIRLPEVEAARGRKVRITGE
jgi:hypothetical protein